MEIAGTTWERDDPMEFRQLQIFRILAHELNFTRTAEKAHCVQSNVTVQIREIEKELGVPLFERLGKNVSLTTHGRILLPYAERILQLLEEASVATAGEVTPSGTLCIGSPESVLTYRLPPVLQSFRSQCPEVDLIFRANGMNELIPQLERGELDFGLAIGEVFEHPRLYVEALCNEPLLLLAHPDHPLLGRTDLVAQDLAGQTFLLTEIGCAYRSKLESVLDRAQVTPGSVMEFTSVETIKHCAALGMGIACLPAIVAEFEIAAGRLASLHWPEEDLSMTTLVAWHRDKCFSPAIKAFFSLLRHHLVAETSRDSGHGVRTAAGCGASDSETLSSSRLQLGAA
ncbi:MAG: LysR family transcriptional regulator [Terracidiphilus sp.]